MKDSQNTGRSSKDQAQPSFKEKFKQKWQQLRLTRWLILIVLATALTIESYLLIGAKMTNVDDLQEQLQITTDIIDSEGQIAGQLSDEQGTYIPLEEISPNIQNAVISTEDKRFYEHHGFDIIGIARAAVGYAVSGDIVGGGSTISQQLAKNTFLTNEQSLWRKFKELFLSLEIEKTYAKDQILEMYLNHSYFGNGVYGVEDASQKYFGKSAAELDLSEAAVIAAALKGPSIYNPVDDYAAALERRDLVLQLMADNAFIDQGTADAAMAAEMPEQNNPIHNDDYQYPYYFDAIIEEAINKFELTEDELMNGGYQIYTNLDQTYQAELSYIYDQNYIFPVAPSGAVAQSASVVLDPETGGVLAIVGGTGEHLFRGFNRATQLKRQPASSLKPLNVYTPALENGFKPDSIIPDEVKSYGTNNYAPENHDFVTQGEILLWQALALSKNTSAVWLMNEIGVSQAMSKLDDFGIGYSEEDMTLSSALGSLVNGTSPIELASAYTAFANGGLRSEPYFITSIVDKEGNVLVEEQTPKQNQAISAEVAKEMTSMMLATYDEGGTGASIEPIGYEIAGKTGTQELSVGDNLNGSNDEWVVAYTPDIVVTSWYGFDETTEENYLWYGSPNSSWQVSNQIMNSLISVSPQTPFETLSATQIYQGEQPESESSESSESSGSDENGQGNSLIDDLIEGGRQLFEDLFGSAR